MEIPTQQSTKTQKRIRNDKLIGFRLNLIDYAMLEDLLAARATNVSDYMRCLILADADSQQHTLRRIRERREAH